MLKVQREVPMVEKLYDTLHLVWKTYHYSAKSRRKLNRLGSELGANIRVATSVKGTRWVLHVQRALEVFLTGIPKDGDLSGDAGQYAATFFHMENLAETSRNADIKGRAKNVNIPITLSLISYSNEICSFCNC